jgi:hypothetical protein
MSTPTYWLAIPGSTEPPTGPLTLSDLQARVRSGVIPSDTVVCEVGQADWVQLADVLPKPSTVAVLPPAAPVAPSVPRSGSQRASIESHYRNLASVGTGTATYGQFIQGLGWLFGVSGIVALFFLEGFWKLAVTIPMLLGVLVHIAGTMIAALGEAMNALKDIAVNSRISADRVEQDLV